MITTVNDRLTPDFARNRLLQALTVVFAVVWVVAAIAPVDRFDWFLENLLVFVAVVLLGRYYRTSPLSDLSYILITAFLVLHMVGAHYTYAKVPFGFWLQEVLPLERNHFDRLIHFGFGLLIVCPVREILFRYAGAGPKLSGFTAFAVIATSSVVFEVVEWIVAVIVSPEAAMAYLGTQGDVFDAQKDSVLAIVGGVLGLFLTRHLFRRRTD